MNTLYLTCIFLFVEVKSSVLETPFLLSSVEVYANPNCNWWKHDDFQAPSALLWHQICDQIIYHIPKLFKTEYPAFANEYGEVRNRNQSIRFLYVRLRIGVTSDASLLYNSNKVIRNFPSKTCARFSRWPFQIIEITSIAVRARGYHSVCCSCWWHLRKDSHSSVHDEICPLFLFMHFVTLS